MEKILNLLKDNQALRTLDTDKGTIVTNSTSDEAYLIAGSFWHNPRKILIIKNNQYEAFNLYKTLTELVNQVVYFPADESLRVESVAYSYELLGERINALYAMTQDKPMICVCHMHSMTRYITPVELFKKSIISLKKGDTIDPLELKKMLQSIGYKNTQRVDSPFYYSRRGEVLDVYTIQYEHPVRIEFFDDEIEEISFYDKDSQRRTNKIESINILPATDMMYEDDGLPQVEASIKALKEKMTIKDEFKDELEQTYALDIESLKAHDYNPRIYQYLSLFPETATIMDYARDYTIITASLASILASYKTYMEENYLYYHELEEIGQMIRGLKLINNPQTILKRQNVDFVRFRENDKQIMFMTQPVMISMANEKVFISQLKDLLTYNRVMIGVDEKRQIDVLVNLFTDHAIPFTLTSATNKLYDGVNLFLGHLPCGMNFVEEKTVLLTSQELFKVQETKKKYIKYRDATKISDYNELKVGDYVVHDTNGIGQYMGIETLVVDGVHKDYLHIAYKGNDILYVPVEQFQLIRKYSSRDGKPPRIHALGSPKWAKEKARVRQKVDGLADDLINLYAERMRQPGFAFEPDGALQLEFESEFGYELTPDQAQAVEEIKKDMETPRPMDRLLCGDVGFGKTEVALRACFKAIVSNKQCAFLCPTTILSSQHYRTMKKRFEKFPINIALLNRFTTTKEKKQILSDLKEGNIDLLVGTHRILSKDVEFKDLGLLCIDEEQRFGVRQKEKIKNLRKTIDVLTLTATPIPRTLQMSIMGIRGLSQIETPPLNRLPVQTYVSEKSWALIKQVIERELSRNGQVFYLHNRTENIYETASTLQTLLPNARIGVGHGQMDKTELEDVMTDFVDKKYDILVCTTIIETGIDIPNANTIIIENADKFGLAQLYQIKGRVGRSERIAYAYLLYTKDRAMTEEAQKRLTAIKEFTQLGSGYKIAMRDLSIRGSGDILGGEQAGFIDQVGFDMYMKILQDAIDEKQGKIKEDDTVPSRNVSVDGYIPEDYVESDMEKLELYQRVYKANDLETLKRVEHELTDLYGVLPSQVRNIVVKRKFDIISHDPLIDDVKDGSQGLEMRFSKVFLKDLDGEKFFAYVNHMFKKPQMKYTDDMLTIVSGMEPYYVSASTEFLDTVLKQYYKTHTSV